MNATTIKPAVPVIRPEDGCSPVLANSRRTKRILTSMGLLLGIVLSQQDAMAQASSLLQYSATTPMINAGIDTDARGTIFTTLQRNRVGEGQRLRFLLTKLDPNTTYDLAAVVGDSTAPTNVSSFTTDRRGARSVVYSQNRFGRAVRGTQLLPSVLNPLCNVRAMYVVNASSEVVLQALLPTASRSHYVVTHRLENSGFIPAAAGSLRIVATTRSTLFRLAASHLERNTDYLLVANGGAGQTLASDRTGKLRLNHLPEGFTHPLDIMSLALTDMGGNVILSLDGLGIPCAVPPVVVAPLDPVNLGAAAGFAVLAGSTVTSSELTIVYGGDVGVSPGTAVVGFPPGVVTNGSVSTNVTATGQAQLDLTTAYNDAAGRTLAPVSVAGNLGGMTLVSGLYKSTSGVEITSGDLTLDAGGDANAVFIFQIASTLTTSSDRKVFLTGNARAANVFWQVGTSATLGTGSVFKGTIMADQSITLNTGADLEGRALARIAAVTLNASTVTIPAP